jgi:hypothetical protein
MILTTINCGPRPPHRVRRWAALLGAALTATSMLAAGQTAEAAGQTGEAAGQTGEAAGASPALGPVFRPSCANTGPGRLTCMSRFRATGVRTTGGRGGARMATALPPGLSPADIASAYKLAAAPKPHTVVAIVDAYDNPNAEADLSVYRATFGLPACTTANECFHKVNQRGAAAPLPTGDPGWGLEISLDLDAVSAACPTCHIMLVEADSNLSPDLGTGVDTAVRLGAKVISNSFGTDEYSGMAADAKHWKHPGTSIVASAGDFGFSTAAYPAVFSSSIAVGGTTLAKSARTARGWTERAWSGSGSGCSAFIGKPAWQKDTHCLMRTVADISAVADPDTGLAMYDTYGLFPGEAGYLVAGGTSLSAPLIAAMITRSGRIIGDASWIYAHPAALNDVVGGSNGYCGGDYLCNAKRGYDAPTGMGTPHGVAGL